MTNPIRLSYFLVFLLLCLFFSCKDIPQEEVSTSALKEEILQLESNLLELELACLGKDTGPGTFMHVVSYDFKEGLRDQAKEEILQKMNSLVKIKGLKSIKVGDVVNTGDSNIKANSGLVLQLAFDSKEALVAYQENEYRNQMDSTIQKMLKAPPIIYDYLLDLHHLR